MRIHQLSEHDDGVDTGQDFATEKRELEMGAAAMAALIYLVDKYGL